MAEQKAKNPGALSLPFVIKVAVPNDQVGVIIGKQGVTHKGIQERCKAQVVVPMVPDADDPEVFSFIFFLSNYHCHHFSLFFLLVDSHSHCRSILTG